MHYSNTSEYYQKLTELQEKLKKSEEERLILEEKFSFIMKTCREEEEKRVVTFREKYEQFLEYDRRRQERNERILQILDRIEAQAITLSAKTERLRLLRKHYEAYLLHLYPMWKNRNKTENNVSCTSHSQFPTKQSDVTLPWQKVTGSAFHPDFLHGKVNYNSDPTRPGLSNHRVAFQQDACSSPKFLENENSLCLPRLDQDNVIENYVKVAANILNVPKEDIVGLEKCDEDKSIHTEQDTSRDLLNVSFSDDGILHEKNAENLPVKIEHSAEARTCKMTVREIREVSEFQDPFAGGDNMHSELYRASVARDHLNGELNGRDNDKVTPDMVPENGRDQVQKNKEDLHESDAKMLGGNSSGYFRKTPELHMNLSSVNEEQYVHDGNIYQGNESISFKRKQEDGNDGNTQEVHCTDTAKEIQHKHSPNHGEYCIVNNNNEYSLDVHDHNIEEYSYGNPEQGSEGIKEHHANAKVDKACRNNSILEQYLDQGQHNSNESLQAQNSSYDYQYNENGVTQIPLDQTNYYKDEPQVRNETYFEGSYSSEYTNDQETNQNGVIVEVAAVLEDDSADDRLSLQQGILDDAMNSQPQDNSEQDSEFNNYNIDQVISKTEVYERNLRENQLHNSGQSNDNEIPTDIQEQFDNGELNVSSEDIVKQDADIDSFDPVTNFQVNGKTGREPACGSSDETMHWETSNTFQPGVVGDDAPNSVNRLPERPEESEMFLAKSSDPDHQLGNANLLDEKHATETSTFDQELENTDLSMNSRQTGHIPLDVGVKSDSERIPPENLNAQSSFQLTAANDVNRVAEEIDSSETSTKSIMGYPLPDSSAQKSMQLMNKSESDSLLASDQDDVEEQLAALVQDLSPSRPEVEETHNEYIKQSANEDKPDPNLIKCVNVKASESAPKDTQSSSTKPGISEVAMKRAPALIKVLESDSESLNLNESVTESNEFDFSTD